MLTGNNETGDLYLLDSRHQKAQLTVEIVIIHATGLGIDSDSVESSMLQVFQQHKMIDIDDSRMILKYTETAQVYSYGRVR